MEDRFVPIRSYHKSTIITLYNNEGEVNWNRNKFQKKINANEELLNELYELGYNSFDKSFTGEQVGVLFKYLGRPILTRENRKLLKLNEDDNHIGLLNLLNTALISCENGSLISDTNMLKQIGLEYQEGKDFNPHYTFRYNDKVYFEKGIGASLVVRSTQNFRVIDTIFELRSLVKQLVNLM